VPPTHSAIDISNTARSKLTDAKCDTRDEGATPSVCRAVATRSATPVCGTTTPLGRPVDPEV
jgi:hypothetical protein